MDCNKIWEEIQDAIKNSMFNEVGYNVHIKPAEAVAFNDSVFTIAVPTSINRNMIQFRFKDKIEAILESHTGQKITLKIILQNEKDDIAISSSKPQTPASSILNEKYTFDSFVIGTSNNAAAAAAISTCENPGHIYNPLFLYGNSGLGKTHLMCAIGNRYKKEHPNAKVLYITTEGFTNDFVECIKSHKMDMFRNKYRTVDMLLIDDVQFLANREGTQEEFFHTFNDLYGLSKQMVFTSDKKPSDLVTLEERIKNRFSQGLTIDVSVPDYETRLAILRKKAEENKYNIDSKILEYIAEKIKSNVRELEGALLKIISLSQMNNRSIDIEFAKDTIESILPSDGIVKITPDKILEKVGVIYKVTKAELIGKSRVHKLVVPRQVAMYLCSKLTDMNMGMIGNTFGGKDRSSVFHNVNKIEKEIKTDQQLKTNIDYIIRDLQSL